MNLFLIILSYLLGSIPFGLIIGKLAGIDVRQAGSKNIGATNVSRLLGKKLGALTLCCDVAKGYFPMLLANFLLPDNETKIYWVSLCGIFGVIGHIFPVFLRFNGGKGVATALGVFLFLSPLAILASLAVFVVAVGITGFVSVGSLLSSALVPFWIWLFGGPQVSIGASIIVALLIWLKHHENIVRLLSGKEKTWRKKSKS